MHCGGLCWRKVWGTNFIGGEFRKKEKGAERSFELSRAVHFFWVFTKREQTIIMNR